MSHDSPWDIDGGSLLFLYPEGALQALGAVRPNPHMKLTWLDQPVFVQPDESQLLAAQGEGYLACLAGLQCHLLEAFQLFDRARDLSDQVAHVKLDCFAAWPAAGVGQAGAHFKGITHAYAG